jgi:hypothetical protein
MDEIFSIFSSELGKLFLFFIPLILLVSFLKSPFFKGLFGEALVNWGIKFLLDKNLYHLFKNVTIPTDNGTTQIDHILVSKYGIFVLETKNMKGWIFGNPNQKTWTQVIYKHKNKFQNPLHQNYKHVKELESCMGVEGHKIFSVIVFIGDSTFKTEMPENVTYGMRCISYIKEKKEVLLTDEEVKRIIGKIESGRLKPTIKTHINHVNHVKSIYKN